MDADTSGHSADSICSDDTEYLLGQNISIREIDDDDLQIHENAKVPSSLRRSYERSPQRSAQKLQPVSSTNLRSPLRQELKVKPGKGPNEYQRSSCHGTAKRSPTMEPSSMTKAKGKPDKKSKVPHNYLSNEVSRGLNSEQAKGQTSSKTKGVKHTQDFEQSSKSKTTVTESYVEHQQIQSFQSPENHKSLHAQSQGLHKGTGSPNVNSELYYDPVSRLTPPTRERINAKRKPTPPGRSPVRQNLPISQDNWEIDSEISLDTLNGVQNTVDVDSNDMESEMSEATEDLIREEEAEDEDITEKLKELNLAVNFDAGTNGEFLIMLCYTLKVSFLKPRSTNFRCLAFSKSQSVTLAMSMCCFQ